MKSASSQGFILVMALFIIALSSILVASLLQRAISHDRLHRVLLKQQYARMLALNGIEIARAQLSNSYVLEGDKNPLEHDIVPFLYTNYSQKFIIPDEARDLKQEIIVYISCENGKINPHLLYNFDEKKYKVTSSLDGQKIMNACADFMQKKYNIVDLERYLAQILAKNPLEDISELIADSSKGSLFLSIDPHSLQDDALTDIFTLATLNPEIQPLYMSESLRTLVKSEAKELTPEQHKQYRLEIAKKLHTSHKNIHSLEQWNELLEPLYKKGYTDMPDAIKKNIASKIETTAFLVISYGKVDNGNSGYMTQKVCAYLEKIMLPELKRGIYIVKRLYWL